MQVENQFENKYVLRKPTIVNLFVAIVVSVLCSWLAIHFSFSHWASVTTVLLGVFLVSFLTQFIFEVAASESHTAESFVSVETEESYSSFTFRQRIALYAASFLVGAVVLYFS